MTLSHGYRVPTSKLLAGDEVYAALGGPKLLVREIGAPYANNLGLSFRRATLEMNDTLLATSLPLRSSFLVATREEYMTIVARNNA